MLKTMMMAACILFAGTMCEAQINKNNQTDTTKRVKPTIQNRDNNNRDTSMNRRYNETRPRTTDSTMYRKNGTMR